MKERKKKVRRIVETRVIENLISLSSHLMIPKAVSVFRGYSGRRVREITL